MSPRIWSIGELRDWLRESRPIAEVSPGVWWPARPLWACSFRDRIRAAWLVFTGKADAVTWKRVKHICENCCGKGVIYKS